MLSPAAYTDKVTVTSTWFQLNNSSLWDLGNGFIYLRISGETLQAMDAGKVIVLGYVNSDYTPYHMIPASISIGTSSTSSTGGFQAVLHGTSESSYPRQIRALALCHITSGTHVYATFLYHL